MHVEGPDEPLEYIFVDELTKKKFILWGNGILEGDFDKLFETEEGVGKGEIIVAMKGEKIEDEEKIEFEEPYDVINPEDPGTAQKGTYGVPDDEDDPWAVREIELTLEPLGLTIKGAKEYRKTAGSILKARMQGAVAAFKRNIKKLLGGPSTPFQDRAQIKLLVKVASDRFIDTLGTTSERAFRLLIEDGMSSVGVNMLKQQLSPETVRALYYDSPLWQTYSKMSEDLVIGTNDIITNHLIRTTDIDKYGKAHGFDRDLMISDLVDYAGLSEKRARVIARTESRVVKSKGKEIGFKIMDPNGEWTYKWGGPYDRPPFYYDTDPSYRNAPSCRWVADQIPKEGVSLEKLKNLVREATVLFHPGLKPRDFSCHPNEMHEPQKVVRRFDAEQAIEESLHQEEGVDTHA